MLELPFIINSPDFEPDSERQAIFLDSNDIDEEKGKISNPGIKKMILLKSKEMYKTLIEYICKNEIKKRYLLARGLRSVPYITRFFDSKWYGEYFISSMRNILVIFPIVWNGEQYAKLTELYFPLIECYESEDDQNKAYNFISILYNNNVPTLEQSKIFEKALWKNDIRIFYCQSLGTNR